MITHLFFDIGSTLVDETECVEARIREVLKQDGAPKREVFEEKIAEFAVNSLQPVKDAALFFGLGAPPWNDDRPRYPRNVRKILRHKKRLPAGLYNRGALRAD